MPGGARRGGGTGLSRVGSARRHLCVAACPREAVTFPNQAPAQLEAEIAALLDPGLASLAPRGVVFVCQHNADALEALAQTRRSYPAGWLPVQVPCVGMLSPVQLLACLAAGAAAVAVLAPGERCPPGQQGTVAGRVAFCRGFLQVAGNPTTPVLLAPASAPGLVELLASLPAHAAAAQTGGLPPQPASPKGNGQPATLSGATAQVAAATAAKPAALLRRLVQASAAPNDVVVAHPHSPFGLVEVAPGCTGCGACADFCPTGALEL